MPDESLKTRLFDLIGILKEAYFKLLNDNAAFPTGQTTTGIDKFAVALYFDATKNGLYPKNLKY